MRRHRAPLRRRESASTKPANPGSAAARVASAIDSSMNGSGREAKNRNLLGWARQPSDSPSLLQRCRSAAILASSCPTFDPESTWTAMPASSIKPTLASRSKTSSARGDCRRWHPRRLETDAPFKLGDQVERRLETTSERGNQSLRRAALPRDRRDGPSPPADRFIRLRFCQTATAAPHRELLLIGLPAFRTELLET